jgi:TctA family transporter
MILGPGLEGNLRRGLLLFDSSWWVFLTRTWVMVILGISFGLLFYGTLSTIRLSRVSKAFRRQALAEHFASGSTSADQRGD